MKVSSYGAVLKYGEQVLVADIGWKGFSAAVYEFIETPEETGLPDIECRLNLVEGAEDAFEDGGHAIAWCMEKQNKGEYGSWQNAEFVKGRC